MVIIDELKGRKNKLKKLVTQREQVDPWFI